MSEKIKQPGNPNWIEGQPSANPKGRPPMSKFERAVKMLADALPPGSEISIKLETNQNAKNNIPK